MKIRFLVFPTIFLALFSINVVKAMTLSSSGLSSLETLIATPIMEACPHSRSMGFWKHQFGVAISGHGSAEVNSSTLWSWLPINIFGMTVNTLQGGYEILSPDEPASMQTRAKQQCFATLLNREHAMLASSTLVDTNYDKIPDMRFGRAWNRINNFYNGGQYETAKNMCESINIEFE